MMFRGDEKGEHVMQTHESLLPFAPSLQKAGEWMADVQQELGTADAQSAYRCLRGTLHALRDQLIPTEASDLAAQLPMLIRGLYFEGYRPTEAPDRIRSCEVFLDRVSRELVASNDPDPAEAAQAIFSVIQNHVTAGEVRDVVGMLPAEIQCLWPVAQL
jgi:uncharacterized protein (DUF2267 family)